MMFNNWVSGSMYIYKRIKQNGLPGWEAAGCACRINGIGSSFVSSRGERSHDQ